MVWTSKLVFRYCKDNISLMTKLYDAKLDRHHHSYTYFFFCHHHLYLAMSMIGFLEFCGNFNSDILNPKLDRHHHSYIYFFLPPSSILSFVKFWEYLKWKIQNLRSLVWTEFSSAPSLYFGAIN